jgi:hypothetical protein
VLFYAGGDWLSAAGQQLLKAYIESGGHLVCLGTYPRLDDNLRPLNRLEIKEPTGILSGSPGGLWLEVLGSRIRSPWAFNYSETPGTSLVATRRAPETQTAEELSLQMGLQAGAQYTIGYTERRGSGCLTVIGLAPSTELLLALQDQLNLKIPGRALTAQVSTALFSRAGEYYIFAVNSGDEDKSAEVLLHDDVMKTPCWRAHNLVSGEEWTLDLRASGRLTFPLPRRDGVVIQLRGA